ncbi:MAG: hypothetical protein K8H86_10860 [Ignavibacteriaceae bacterium]|nr:hypothetical protein [Ignavibacteriaceae bacterium]
MENFIRFILSNFTLTFFLIGLIFSFVSIYRNRKRLTKAFTIEAILKYYCFWAHGITWTYNGIMHTVFHTMAASFIGWADSPFQLEVGFASLGFGIIGLLSIKNNFGLRLGLMISTSVFLWGAAGGHIYEILVKENYASGNAGIMLWTGLLLPVINIVLLYLSYKSNKVKPEDI